LRPFFSVVWKASSRRVTFNGVYVTIFSAKAWKKLIFEWILRVDKKSLLRVDKIANSFSKAAHGGA
jgi:hypothetical protein